MKFQLASISIHTDIERIESISKSFNSIMESLREQSSTDKKTLMIGLFEIIRCLKEKLYKDKNFQPSKEKLDSIIESFDIDGDAEDENASYTVDSKFYKFIWDNWKNKEPDNPLYLKNVNCEDMEIYIGGKDCCTIEAAYKHEGEDFSKAMKHDFGGNRWYGVWIKKFNGEFADIKRSDFYAELEKNTKLQETIKEWYGKIIPRLEAYHVTCQLKKAIKQSIDLQSINNKPNLWIYEYTTLVIDIIKENNVNLFIDIQYKEDERIWIVLGERNNRQKDYLDKVFKEAFKSEGESITIDGDKRYRLTSFAKDTSVEEITKTAVVYINKLNKEFNQPKYPEYIFIDKRQLKKV